MELTRASSTSVTRRELVAAFLGAAVASSCRWRRARATVPGTIVDRAFERGHLLRDEVPRGSGSPIPLEVAIVGAGAAGLSAGWRLAAGGCGDFRVLELDEDVGGTSRSGRSAVCAFPWGAHYLPAPVEDVGPLSRLLRELGAIVGVNEDGRPSFAEEMLIREPEERVFYKGAWYEGLYLRAGARPEDLAELERFEAKMRAFAAARDGRGRKAFAVPIGLGSEDAEWTGLDRLSMAEWLEENGFRSPRLRWYVDYACRDDFGATAADVSAWAGIFYFAARNEGPARSAGYLSWPEGNGRLISHLARATGEGRITRDALVHTLEPGKDHCLVHALVGPERRPVSYRARQVIFAGPRFVAARVLAPWRRAPPEGLAEFHYGPWVVANLTLKERPRSHGFPLAWDNVLYESKSLGYVVATHQLPRADDTGPTVFTWYYPLTGRDTRAERARALSAQYTDWEALVMADLLPAHAGLEALATRLEVMRWGHAMIRPRPGFLWSPARKKAQESLGERVHFAHTDLSGLALFEEANWHGVRAAERALRGLGREVSSWLG